MDIVWSLLIFLFCAVLLTKGNWKAIAIIVALYLILAFPIAGTI